MNLIIADTPIRQTPDGLYCLNDLHRASGGEKRHQPAQWLRLKQTQELIEEITKPGISGLGVVNPISVQRGGAGQGTYVCNELVYAYATWISTKFFLKVIRVFHRVMTGQPAAQPDLVAIQTQLIAQGAEIGQLKDELIDTQRHALRALGRVSRLEARQARAAWHQQVKDRNTLILNLEQTGTPREKIIALTGLTANYIRQIIFQAQRSGWRPHPFAGQADFFR